MSNNIYRLETLDNGQLDHLLRHCYDQCCRSFQALEMALEAHIRREPETTPIWALREAHADNLNRFEQIMAEVERRQIP